MNVRIKFIFRRIGRPLDIEIYIKDNVVPEINDSVGMTDYGQNYFEGIVKFVNHFYDLQNNLHDIDVIVLEN